MGYNEEKEYMKSKAVQFLEAHQSGECSTFMDDVKWRQENAAWLRKSRRVAFAVMDYMKENNISKEKLAEEMAVTPDFVSNLLSGKVKANSEVLKRLAAKEQLKDSVYSDSMD